MDHTLTTIGKTAVSFLSKDQPATVMGATSKGAFLHLAVGQIVFISVELFRGPLTLNVKGDPGWLDFYRPGLALAVQTGRIRHCHDPFGLDVRTAAVWEAPKVSRAVLVKEERIAILKKVAAFVIASRAGAGLTPLLGKLVGLPNPIHMQSANDAASIQLHRLRQSLVAGQVEAALDAAESFLGLGSGLTPSGDDLLLGLLLALNRWGSRGGIRFDGQEFNQGILERALRRTTTLSSNLLACAADGQADERLVAALDGLLTGHPGPESITSHLTAWGSSSGCDAFVGMALAVLVLSSNP
jgi:hypothetical protein